MTSMLEQILVEHADIYGKPVEDVLKQALGQYFSSGSGRTMPLEQRKHLTPEIRQQALKEYFNGKQSFVMNLNSPCGRR